jgi:hypothetical protein
MINKYRQAINVMKYYNVLILSCAVSLTAVIGISGCTQNVREQSPDTIAGSVIPVSRADSPDLVWFAPELHISHYRMLFYGYDTVDYRLAAPENPENRATQGFSLLVDAHYGGNVRHYDFAKMPYTSIREVSHKQQDTVRCQIFNSLISSCLYRDRFRLNVSRSELELGLVQGIQLLLRSETQEYETLDLPSNYLKGFLKAIEKLKTPTRSLSIRQSTLSA